MLTKRKQLQAGDIIIHVTRKNMKNMYLRVKTSNGEVEVSAPNRVSDKEILHFVQERKGWIRQAQERLRIKEEVKKEEPILVPFMERELRQALKKQISGLIAKWEPVMGVHSNGFTIKKMKSRWGSCNVNSHHLNFSFSLAKVRPELVEYVVVHELTHLLEASHSPRFWALMEHYLPGAKKLRYELNHQEVMSGRDEGDGE